jgi:hypothetical protein
MNEDKKKYCKSLIGKKAYRLDMPERIGVLNSIVFFNKDYSICWFDFKWKEGGYMVSINEIKILENKNVQFELFI